MKFWQWLTGLFGRWQQQKPLLPLLMVEALTERTLRRRVFHVTAADWEPLVVSNEVARQYDIHLGSPALDPDGNPDPRFQAVSISVGEASSCQWIVIVEYARPRHTEPPTPLPPGEPLTTDALRQLCTGAGTDGAVTFTSEGGWRKV